MKELIKKLAIESSLIYEDNGKLMSAFFQPTDMTEEVEDFVESIVKLCAWIVNHQQRTTGHSNHAEMLCEEFGIEFKEEDYFGV